MNIAAMGNAFNWADGNKDEGWRVEKVPNATFAHNVVFDSEDAKILFLLKYGAK